jgi:branched-chain amino acid transport system substrate-binding protein
MTTTLLNETGLAAVGSLAGYAWLPEIEVPASRKFIQNFEKKYPGKAPDWFAACGYQGAKIILTALQNIGGKAEDKEAFLKALIEVKVKPEDNIYTEGVLTFDPKYRAPIVDQYLAKIVEADGKAKREVIDVIKGVPPKVLPGFKE